MRPVVFAATIIAACLIVLAGALLGGDVTGRGGVAAASTPTPTQPPNPPGNHAPVAHDGEANAFSGYAVVISLEGHDVDFCGGGQTHGITNVIYDPAHAELANQSYPSSCQNQPANGYALLITTFEYTADVGFVGDDVVTFAYWDGYTTGNQATFTVHVEAAASTPTPSPIPTPTPTPTPTMQFSATPCPTVSPTNCDVGPTDTPTTTTPTPTPTPTPTMQFSATPCPTVSPTNCDIAFTPTPTPTGTPTPTPTLTPSPTMQFSATPCPTVSPTNCDIAFTPTPTPTGTATPTPAATSTPVCPNGVVPQWPVSAGDSDCDGFPDSVLASGKAPESYIGTDAMQHCAATPGANNDPLPDAMPPDFNDDQIISGQDTGKYGGPGGAYNHTVAEGPFNGIPGVRFDFSGDGIISGQDTGKFQAYYNKTCA